MKPFIKLLRPQHYIKNLFILLPAFFAGKMLEPNILIPAMTAVLAFSFLASAVYIMNDYLDIEQDKLHPTKQYRPLANGQVSKPSALLLMIGLLAAGLIIMACLAKDAFWWLVLYWLMNLAYSFKLKHVAILDVHIIAIGFVLRLLVGAVVTDIALSMWIVTTTFLLTLFLALAKRRDDILIYQKSGKKMRSVVDGYSLPLIDNAMTIMAAVVIVSYLQYATTTSDLQGLNVDYLYLSVVFVILGIMRYLQIALIEEKSGSPIQIALTDRFIQWVLVGWVLFFVWVLYL